MDDSRHLPAENGSTALVSAHLARTRISCITSSAALSTLSLSSVARLSEKGVRLAQKNLMQVGPCTPVGIQLSKG